jgi:hypothetical protein
MASSAGSVDGDVRGIRDEHIDRAVRQVAEQLIRGRPDDANAVRPARSARDDPYPWTAWKRRGPIDA